MVGQPLTPFSEFRGSFALLAASPEVIPLSTLGLGKDHVKERTLVTPSAILGCDRRPAIPPSTRSASTCWVQLTPPVTQSWPWKLRKCFPMLDQDIAHFPPQEESPNVVDCRSLVWWPQPPIHIGWAGPAVSGVFLAVDLYYSFDISLRYLIKVLVFSRIHYSVCTE